MVLPLGPHLVDGANKLPKASFLRALIPFVRASPSQALVTFQSPPLSAVTLGVLSATINQVGRGTHIQTMTQTSSHPKQEVA